MRNFNINHLCFKFRYVLEKDLINVLVTDVSSESAKTLYMILEVLLGIGSGHVMYTMNRDDERYWKEFVMSKLFLGSS